MKERAINRERAIVAHHQTAKIPEPGRWCVRRSIVSCSAAALGHPASRAARDSSCAGRSVRSRVAASARAADRCRMLCRRPPAAVSALDDPRDDAALRGSWRASFPRVCLPPGMQSEGTFPEEDRGRRPPPSTPSPCHAWFFRLLAFVQLAQKRSPDVQPNAPLLPISQSPPAPRRMREFLRQVLPASPAPQNPQNPFQHPAVLDPRTTALALFGRLGEQGRDFLPLRLGQQRTAPRHRPCFGAADFSYLPFPNTQP